jgi:hypothetical protein
MVRQAHHVTLNLPKDEPVEENVILSLPKEMSS